MEFTPIGRIHTPFADRSQAPITTSFSKGAVGRVELFAEYAECLQDVEGFERIWLLWHADHCDGWRPIVQPPFRTPPKGLFATRAPCRPNAIGLSCVRLLGVDGAQLRVADVDMLDGTPLLDIKPYSTLSDAFPEARTGWFDDAGEPNRR
jgi:tRNA-Thr(GGU) m(6)t(6)A37 methyltransferase TsaA